jgi:glycerol-3-phosphate O-acyltransferase
MSLYGLWIGLVRKVLFVWVRTRVLEDQRARLASLDDGPILYVLERSGFAEAAVLDEECRRAERTLASRGFNVRGLKEPRASLFLRPSGRRKPDLAALERAVRAVGQGEPADVTVVPVSIFWGRSPEKEGSALKLLLSDDWAIGGTLRKLFMILAHGRDVMVQFSAPVSVREFIAEGLPPERTVRKLARVLRVHFRSLRVATIGPDLSHRRTMVSQILESQSVQAAMAREMQVNGISEAKAWARAREYAFEIAADFSYPFVRFLERILRRLWDKLYDGVEIGHLDSVKACAEDSELVYVPCHRSHIDYLLLSYVVYRNGLMCPHIAAGLNLNLPVVGRFLRRGGAFFLRRSFRDNALYAAVFNKYLSLNLAKGVPIEYFIEGGRSRTGRLLPARPGMLAMTVRSYLRRPARPLSFVPVYFGYERLLEGDTYLSELSGQPKKRESLLGLFRSLRALRSRFGKVHVNFGEPIVLGDLLDEEVPDWRERPMEAGERPKWVQPLVRDLGEKILTGINAAAAINPVNLVATAMLSMPRRSMLETELLKLLDLHLALLREARYSEQMTVCDMSPREILDYTERFGLLKRMPHKLGDIMYMQEDHAALGSYFRNNVAHLFSLPSLIGCAFRGAVSMDEDCLKDLLRRIYPYVKGELFLHWSRGALDGPIERNLRIMIDRGLITHDEETGELRRAPASTAESLLLSVIARGGQQALERYYVVVALLLKHGPGVLTQSQLEELCKLMAQRLSVLYQFNAPEFFDRSLFRGFISRLKGYGVLTADEHGRLGFGDALTRADADARAMLGESLRHDILQVVYL